MSINQKKRGRKKIIRSIRPEVYILTPCTHPFYSVYSMPSTIQLRSLSPDLPFVEVEGWDLSRPLTQQEGSTLRNLMETHGVLVFKRKCPE